MKRIALLVATNLAILLALSVTVELAGIGPYLQDNGLDLKSLLGFAAVLGFGGAFMSLALSKWLAKRSMGVRVIETPVTAGEQWLLAMVSRHSERSGIATPEVGIYESPDLNAFATGMNRNRALVAVSTGLLERMTRPEAEAVLAHEVAHVANGDMVTLSLIQGVLNTFVLLMSRVIGTVVDRAVFRTESGQGPAFWVTVLICELALGILASLIVMGFSRQREFRADQGGARLAGHAAMVAALRRLERAHAQPLPSSMVALGISGAGRHGWRRLFMTHPPLAERIAALETMRP